MKSVSELYAAHVVEITNDDSDMALFKELDSLRDLDNAKEVLSKDVYSTLVKGVTSFLTDLHSEGHNLTSKRLAYVKGFFKRIESEYKKSRDVKVMPGSYRSSKSVIIKALKNGVPLVSGDGEVLGKTAVERTSNTRDGSKKDTTTSISGGGTTTVADITMDATDLRNVLRATTINKGHGWAQTYPSALRELDSLRAEINAALSK